MIDFYLNNLDFLQKFCDYFKEAGKSLISHAEQNKLMHDFYDDYSNKGIEQPQFINSNDFYYISRKFEYTLSPRQYEVAYLLIKGQRAKQIARALEISHRTVEDYIANLKNKLNAKNIMDLTAKLTVHLNLL